MISHIQSRTEEEVAHFLKGIMREALGRFPVLEPYTNILEFVFIRFYRRDGLIFFKEHKEGAYIKPDMINGQYIYNLNIGLLNRTDPFTILWSILHEYGHSLQDARTEEVRLSPELTLERETDAWDKSEEVLPQFNLPDNMLSNFNEFRASRLQSYQNKIQHKQDNEHPYFNGL